MTLKWIMDNARVIPGRIIRRLLLYPGERIVNVTMNLHIWKRNGQDWVHNWLGEEKEASQANRGLCPAVRASQNEGASSW